MGKLKKYTLTLIALMLCIGAAAQTTKIRGRVVDEEGEGIPFVGVYFDGTTTGITTDLDGYYNLECRDLSRTTVTAQLLGYDPETKEVKPGKFTELNFKLKLTKNELSASRVKADNKKARRLLANIQSRRDKNDPDKHPEYSCDVYNKMELDLTHPYEQFTSKKFKKEFGFVFDYVDTSAISGIPYLPVMISESVARRNHSSNPEVNNETVLANRISGINPDMNLLSQFTGSLHLKVNFYDNFVNAFGIEFPSPIQPAALLYYNYYIIDSLMVDGRKTLLVRYHPKPLVSTPTFDGEMKIDAEDFAIRSIHANMRNITNVNFMRDLVLDAEYARQEDSTWFYKSDKLYVDLSMSLSDSSKMLSFIGKREMVYSNVDFSPKEKLRVSDGLVKVKEDAGKKDEDYWAEVRPEPLTEKEQSVYEMVERIKTVPMYKNLYSTVYTLINGYWELGPIGIGPYYKLFSFNDLEGFRPQIGFRTSKDFSRKDRFTAYTAYGTRDLTFKGGGSWEHLWNREPERKLTLGAKYDVYQLGSGDNALTEGNIFASIFGGNHNVRLSLMSDFYGKYEHEFNMNLNATAGFRLRRYYPSAKPWVKEQFQVPMLGRDSSKISSVASNELYATLRFSYKETVNRGYFTKTYVHTNYPIVAFTAAGSVGGIRKNDYSYFRPEIDIYWNPNTPPFGQSLLRVNAGKIFGSVPYPLLHLHEGNSTFLLNKQAFSCMDYMEFASDTWVTVFYNHCFWGYFLGKIPLLRRMGLREEVTAKATWGSLSDKNNGNLADFSGLDEIKAPMLFPNGTSKLGKVPYVEVGVGISNILKFLRVDCFWRVTHRNERVVVNDARTETGARVLDHIKTSNFAVQVGAEFRF